MATEKILLNCLTLAVEAAFNAKMAKRIPIERLRVLISVVKNLARTENELRIIDDKTYIRFAEQLVEISKMASGWLSYITQKER